MVPSTPDRTAYRALPVGRVPLGADADLQFAQFPRRKAHVPGSVTGSGALRPDRAGLALALGEPRHDQRGSGRRGSRVGAMPSPADLPLRAGDLVAIEVAVEIIAVEALVAAMLGRVTGQRPGDGDLVFSGSVFPVDQAGVATVEEMLGGQQITALQTSVDARQGLEVARRGRGSGDIGDHVGALGRTGLGEVGEESLPSG